MRTCSGSETLHIVPFLDLVIEFFLQEDILMSVLVAYPVLQQTNS